MAKPPIPTRIAHCSMENNSVLPLVFGIIAAVAVVALIVVLVRKNNPDAENSN